jgi:hypothetical protein
LKKKEDLIEVGNVYEHQTAKDYSTQELNSSVATKMIAIKHSCKFLHQENPLTIPCGRSPRK